MGDMNLLVLTIPGYTDVSGHTEYIIKSSVGDQHFAVQHRFSNFIELHETLISKLSKLPASFPVAKSMFGGEAIKRERVEKLQDYLRTVVKVSGERPPAVLLKFLRVDVSVFTPIMISGGEGIAGGATGDGPLSNSEPVQPFQPFCGPQGAFVPERPDDINEALREGIKAGDNALCLELIDAKADPLYRDRQGTRAVSAFRCHAHSCMPHHALLPCKQAIRRCTWHACSIEQMSPRRCCLQAQTSRSRTVQASCLNGWHPFRSR